MAFAFSETGAPRLRGEIERAWRPDEARALAPLLQRAALSPGQRRRVERLAAGFVARVRAQRREVGGLDAFLNIFDLSSREGVALMCLAEALLRVPDAATADRLIRDKLAGTDWRRQAASESLFVNASVWGLMLTGRVVALDPERDAGLVARLAARLGEPLVREATVHAVKIVGRQFVMGATIGEALQRAQDPERRGWRHSYDMLGEAARTAGDARRYLAAYERAIDAVGEAGAGLLLAGPGVSVKLSALHPRYEPAQHARVAAELAPRLIALAARARRAGLQLTVDAEEADRLELSLDVFEAAAGAVELAGWDGLGIAVQAYQKRAGAVLAWLERLARAGGRRLPVRLVKGAYWDSEIKRAQERGLAGYPVFTRKAATDVSYIACARFMLDRPQSFHPQFATHNALTLATLLVLAEDAGACVEFQRLHGMGEALYRPLVEGGSIACRVYAPVGAHRDLLAYLVRRLLENGANSSFVNRIADDALPEAALIEDPAATLRRAGVPHPAIPLPADLFAPERRNSKGFDLGERGALAALAGAMEKAAGGRWRAAPTAGGGTGTPRPIANPADRRRIAGEVVEADEAAAQAALAACHRAAAWSQRPAGERAACLERAADLLEAHRAEAMAIAVREAGKTLADAVAEIREAVDFCRYYASLARRDFSAPEELPGPTGESNRLSLHGRGVFLCISPWNFPLAIFCGQVAAALAAGNAVIAKPAEQTPLMAAFAVSLLHEAGVPRQALALLPGGGGLGRRLVGDARIAGVAFTGSTQTARAIARRLAARRGPIVPLIAETGGQNAMIVDSTALPEQVSDDVIRSAFASAGQRCSALRVLCLQDDIAGKTLDMLEGAAAELKMGDPALLETDIGPVIDEQARAMLEGHIERLTRECRLLWRLPADEACRHGSFVAPAAIEIDSLQRLQGEAFGPVLHILRFPRQRLDDLLDAIEASGYGLTLGIHTRIDSLAKRIAARARVGNIYVNRNMIGAAVGSQPFGGEGLSGTGPKAGGPRYLHRFATERSLSIDTTAAGGNAALMTLGDG